MVTNLYPPNHLGGYELLCHDAVTEYRARGHVVEVLTSNVRLHGAPSDDGLRKGVRRELEMYWDDHVLLEPGLWSRFGIERRNQASLKRAIAQFRPDVVCVWNMGALSLGILATVAEAGLPMVTYICDDWLLYGMDLDAWSRTFDGHAVRGRIATRLTGLPTGPPDLGAEATHCFISQRTLDRAQKFGRWDLERCTVIYSGIDRQDFPHVEPGDRRWRGRLLYVGRIDPRKGIDIAVRAVAELPEDMTLEVIGRGDEVELHRLRDLVAELGVEERVVFRGDLERRSLIDRYREADVLLFPSTWEEPFGLVPLEAMACATPVVASPVGGSAEFLWHEGNCLAVPPDDVQAVAAAVVRLADDAALRNRLVRGGLHTAAQLTVTRMLDALERWLDWATRPETPRPEAVAAPEPPPQEVLR